MTRKDDLQAAAQALQDLKDARTNRQVGGSGYKQKSEEYGRVIGVMGLNPATATEAEVTGHYTGKRTKAGYFEVAATHIGLDPATATGQELTDKIDAMGSRAGHFDDICAHMQPALDPTTATADDVNTTVDGYKAGADEYGRVKKHMELDPTVTSEADVTGKFDGVKAKAADLSKLKTYLQLPEDATVDLIRKKAEAEADQAVDQLKETIEYVTILQKELFDAKQKLGE